MSNKMRVSQNFSLIILIAIWASVHLLLISHFGIVTKGEPEKYIREANNLINYGNLSSSNFWLYSTQIFLIFFSLKIKLGYEFVIGLQLIFSLIATLSFYRLSTFLFTRTAGVIATVWFLLNLPIHQFNTFLQTDSLFYSFIVIYACYLLMIRRLSVKVIACILLALMLISITRPTGLFFFPATFLYLYFRFFKRFRFSYKILFLISISIVFLYFLNAALGSGGELDFMLPARDERIICGVPTLPYFVRIDEIENGNSLYGLFYYISHNLSQFARLAFQRSIAFFGLVRPYYNTTHNIYLVILFYPIYLMGLLSIKYWIKNNPFVLVFIFSLVSFTWTTVILSCDDWHNRFYLTISPYLIILALPVISRLFSKNIS